MEIVLAAAIAMQAVRAYVYVPIRTTADASVVDRRLLREAVYLPM